MERSEPLGRFLTIADVAELLSISTRQTYSLVRSGELAAIKVGGGQWRVERSVLEGYIEALYEENRRAGLWRQAEHADVAEFSLDARRGGL